MNNQVYQERLHDHYRNPRNRGVLANPILKAELHNSSCGDSVAITASAHENHIDKLMFTGQGCIISQGTASLLTEHLAGSSFHTILAYDKDYMMQLLGITLGPVRAKCALLPLHVVQQAIVHYMQESAGVRSYLSNAGIAEKS